MTSTRASYFERRFVQHFGAVPPGMTDAQISEAVTKFEKASETETLRGDIASLLEGTAR